MSELEEELEDELPLVQAMSESDATRATSPCANREPNVFLAFMNIPLKRELVVGYFFEKLE